MIGTIIALLTFGGLGFAMAVCTLINPTRANNGRDER